MSFHFIPFISAQTIVMGKQEKKYKKDDAYPYTLSLPHVQLVFNGGVQLFG